MKGSGFHVGLDVLLDEQADLLKGKRIGLVSHMAALDGRGMGSAERVMGERGCRLTALLGPEHGFLGCAGAGETLGNRRHPVLRVPIYSLYGETRRPTAAMLRNVDVLLFDMQDIGTRCYTYVATLRHVMEAAAEFGKGVLVADRPIPLPMVVDGPMPDAGLMSFVASIPAPMVYGMTPGETALWLRRRLGLDLDLHVAPMRGYRRENRRAPDWPPWVPPSPGIRSW